MQPFTLAKVHKDGSSLAIVLPKEMCRALGIERGDQVAIRMTAGGTLAVLPLTSDAYRKIIKA